jgi:EAL domain-containing protein (putative c-di-GMP-specific phosphodiesterase class I)/CheY-like chemotaxis protein
MSDVVGSDGAAILVVDDDDTVLSVLQRALVAPGVRITVANSGVRALAELKAHSFDVLVSDIRMPGMSGIKLLHAVREHDLDLPVVMMTGSPDLKTAAAAVQYGAFQYLIKPVEVERLRAVVGRAINVGRAARLKREYVQEFGSSSFYVGDRAAIESTLNRALRSLWVAYQPVVRARDGITFGYEALLRSEEPLLVHPSAVLKAAEKVGRIHEVGRAVRDLVAIDADRIPEGSALMFVSLHPEDLVDPALYLPITPLASIASRVVFELTDRASLEQVSEVQTRVERLRALGFRFAIDDLGAEPGDSRTSQLLDPEFVKLDVSVVRGVDREPAKMKIVHSIIGACHDLGSAVIVGGVENAGQRNALVDAGCDFLQGYLFGRPSSLDASKLKVARRTP